ncbi:MAG TPA: hypothetical protein VM427_09675 [Patescibacteria group bacterium]|nr:hypothetical protein [Patescibacteria group bacterium]
MMPEILTESFCERCGTRYTFESAAPGKTRRIGKFKTLSKGMKNWVMSDDTSLDEAMAAARNDEEREQTSHQLDAFHATFNFCMTCRQYTCGNCWNAADGRCLTCAPNLAYDPPTPFPELAQVESLGSTAAAWPEVDLTKSGVEPEAKANGHAHDDGPRVDEIGPWDPASAADPGDTPDVVPAAGLASPSGDIAAPTVEGDAAGWVEGAADAVAFEAIEMTDAEAGGTSRDPKPVTARPGLTDGADAAATGSEADLPVADPELAAGHDAVGPETEPVVLSPEREPAAAADLPPSIEGPARSGDAKTSDLLQRFRPGQNIDAELAAYEEGRDASIAAQLAELVVAESEPLAPAEPDPVAAAEPEPVAAEEPEAVAEPEVVAAAEPGPVEPPPAAEPARDDRVEQPTWRIVAPDPSPVPGTADQPHPPTDGPAPISASSEPQWPARPEMADSPAMSLLTNRGSGSPSDGLWAASAQEVIAAPVGRPLTGAPTGVQPCANCGLSLSATARFCRRCGSRQG